MYMYCVSIIFFSLQNKCTSLRKAADNGCLTCIKALLHASATIINDEDEVFVIHCIGIVPNSICYMSTYRTKELHCILRQSMVMSLVSSICAKVAVT